jgi:hypothetical protein
MVFEIIFPELILCLHVQVLVATVICSFISLLHFSYFVTVNVASIITLFVIFFTLLYSIPQLVQYCLMLHAVQLNVISISC